jgi:DNA-binding NtrC family response regulator
VIVRLLDSPDLKLSFTRHPAALWAKLAREEYDLVIAAYGDLPAPAENTISTIRALPDAPEIIVLTEKDDPEERAALIAAGAIGVIYRHVSDARLGEALQSLVERRREVVERRVMTDQTQVRSQLSDFASESEAMANLLVMARRVAEADTSVLVLGETGVGKEWLARAIHENSLRSQGPFVAVNCAALPEGLLESELFGHTKGAFTGAHRARRGFFELAHGGTLFLDEVGEMPVALQAKLLRALQEHEVRPVGGEESVPVDVRIMAASNRDLEEAMADKQFRADLFYRLSVIVLTVPRLADRREDILVLLDTYVARFAEQMNRPVDGIADDATQALAAYDWPGNVRELINVIERAVLLSDGGELTMDDLPVNIAGQSPALDAASTPRGSFEEWLSKPLLEAREQIVERFEREYLVRTLEDCRGRVGEAARRAKVDPRTLYNKMQRYGLTKAQFRQVR